MDRYTGTAGISNAVSDLIILGGFVLSIIALVDPYLPVPQDGRALDPPPVSCFVYPPWASSADQVLEFCYQTATGGKNLFYIPLSAAIAATVGNLGCVYGRVRRKETSDGIFVAYLLYFVVLVFSFLLLLLPGSWTPMKEMHRQETSAILVSVVCGLHFLAGVFSLLGISTSGVLLNGGLDQSYFLIEE